MEYNLYSKDSAYPCEVTIDEENGRYMIRKADTSGEIFNSAAELNFLDSIKLERNRFSK